MRPELINARKSKGFTVEEMAKMLKVSPSVYYKWEDGTRTPLIKNAYKVAQILNKPIEALFGVDSEGGTSSLCPTGTDPI